MEMTGGIEVRITGGTPLEVLARITAWGLRASSEPRVYALASQIMALEEQLKVYDKNGDPVSGAAPASASSPAPASAPADSPADPPGPAAGETGPSAAPSEGTTAAPAQAPAPEEAPAPKPTTGKPPSLEDIRAKGIEAAKKYGQAAVKAILKEFNSENMTALPEDKRAEFLVKLEGLGGGNA